MFLKQGRSDQPADKTLSLFAVWLGLDSAENSCIRPREDRSCSRRPGCRLPALGTHGLLLAPASLLSCLPPLLPVSPGLA